MINFKILCYCIVKSGNTCILTFASSSIRIAFFSSLSLKLKPEFFFFPDRELQTRSYDLIINFVRIDHKCHISLYVYLSLMVSENLIMWNIFLEVDFSLSMKVLHGCKESLPLINTCIFKNLWINVDIKILKSIYISWS